MSSQLERLESLALGPLPLVNHFLDRRQLRRLLDQALQPRPGRPPDLPPAAALGLFVRNLRLARAPLYGLPEWAGAFVPESLGLRPDQTALLNDDRIGRCLDLLFESDRAAFLTAFFSRMIEQFELQLDVLHKASTSVRFTGRYPRKPKPATLWITHGFSKDHRPDLRQLIFELPVTEDGAVPILVGLHNGNVTDDQTHRQTWDQLRARVGRADFIDVADCKLCVRETLTHSTRNGGHFVTVLPATRKEEKWFKPWIQTHSVAWQDVWPRPPLRRRADSPDIFQGGEAPLPSAEGSRILWYHSSAKQHLDQQRRQTRIGRAVAALEFLQTRTGADPLKSVESVAQAAQKILQQTGAARWIEVGVEPAQTTVYRQTRRGRPGPQTAYRQVSKPRPKVRWRVREEAVVCAAKEDGLFPLVTDLPAERANLKQVLRWYKFQPRLEKRFEQLKTVFEIRPVFLKKGERVAAFRLLYFVAGAGEIGVWNEGF